jgi:hypothetical protein
MAKHEISKLKLNLELHVGDLKSRMKFKRKRNSFIKSSFFPKIIHAEKVLEQISRRIGFTCLNCHSFGYLMRCINCNRYLASNGMVIMYVTLDRMKKGTAVTFFNILPLNSQRTTEESHGNLQPG